MNFTINYLLKNKYISLFFIITSFVLYLIYVQQNQKYEELQIENIQQNQKYKELQIENIQQNQKYKELQIENIQQNQKYEELFNKSGKLTKILRNNNALIKQLHKDINLCDFSSDVMSNGDFFPSIPYFINNNSEVIKYNLLNNFSHEMKPVLIIPQTDLSIFPVEIRSNYPNITISILTETLKSQIKPYDFYIVYSNQEGIPCKKQLRLYLSIAPEKVNSPLYIFGRIGDDYGQFSVPYGSDIDQELNTVFVSDCTNNLVQEFDLNGNLVNIIDNHENNGFGRPTDIKLVNNKIYIIDELKNQLDIFDRDGNFLNSIGTTNRLGKVESILNLPLSIAVNDIGNLFVVDYGSDRVLKLSENGHVLKIIGPNEKFDGITLNGPYYADFNEELKRLYIVDRTNNRVVVFDKDGNYLFTFGKLGSSMGEFDYPHEIEITDNGNIFIADTNNKRVQIFDYNGVYINKIDIGEGFAPPKTVAVSNIGIVMIGHIGEEAYITSWPNPTTNIHDIDSSMINLNQSNAIGVNTAKITPSDKTSTYEKYCSSCHRDGVFGAPKAKIDSDWDNYPRDINTLLKLVNKGEGSMQFKGGCLKCSDDELIKTIKYMLPSTWEIIQ